MISPFISTGPTSGLMFFGRETELRNITESIRDSNFIILGGRRIGKTSMLLSLYKNRLPLSGCFAIYHDCSLTPYLDQFTSTKIYNFQPNKPSDDLLTFGDIAHYSNNVMPLVILLDEIDKIISEDNKKNWELLRTLRAWSNNNDKIRFIISGERSLRQAIGDPSSPLFNFGKVITLGPLDYRSIENLISVSMSRIEVEISNEYIPVIYKYTSGHPNIVQRFCSRIIQRLSESERFQITYADINSIANDPNFQRDDFLATIWETATPLEKIVSLVMVDNGEINTLQKMRKELDHRFDLRPPLREIDESFQCLVELRSLLRKTSSGYVFLITSFPTIIAGTATLQDMLDIYIEEYREGKII